MSQSHVLLLTICSNGKEPGGNLAYTAEGSFLSLFPEYAADLIQARRRVFQLIKGGTASRMGMPLAQFPHNDQLSDGPDFGGCAQAEYLSSAERFRGRFYRELEPEGSKLLTFSPHHVLIICGVYGVLTPAELIQAYNCYVDDHEEIGQIWRYEDILTSLLLSYIRTYRISMVFDLMADNSFRSLVNWAQLKKEVKVFRAFGDENVGADLLPSLGVLCREWLLTAPEKELVSIQANWQFSAGYEDVILTPRDVPPKGFLGNPDTGTRSINGSGKAASDLSAPKESIEVLAHARDINVTAGQHNTMFDRKIQKMSDLPPEARKIFEDASRIPDVLEVFLGKFHATGGKSKGGYYLTLTAPKEGMGSIFCKLRGPGKIGGMQDIEIRVTKGWEKETFLRLSAFSWADY